MPRDYTHEMIALGKFEGATVPMAAQEQGQVSVTINAGTISYYDTAANLEGVVLPEAVFGFAYDTSELKVGDGVTAWGTLPLSSSPANVLTSTGYWTGNMITIGQPTTSIQIT